jgi:hypothetical protein
MKSILQSVPCVLEKNFYFAFAEPRTLQVSDNVVQVLISLLIFDLVVLPIIEVRILPYVVNIAGLSISPRILS